jgi:sterol desaturase/sphingolipid hydroxylase (fatty acid hydroxylase superfamily)
MLEWLIGFGIALVLGSLVEYWGHRLMHAWLLKKRHARHHRDGDGQGWLGEFRDYFLGSVVFLPWGFLYSWQLGLGWLAGGIVYGMFAAYSHQLQHEKPELCFWLVRPVHYLHHENHQWHHNFGISLDIWDRVFGTYKKMTWNLNQHVGKRNFWDLFRIRWY